MHKKNAKLNAWDQFIPNHWSQHERILSRDILRASTNVKFLFHIDNLIEHLCMRALQSSFEFLVIWRFKKIRIPWFRGHLCIWLPFVITILHSGMLVRSILLRSNIRFYCTDAKLTEVCRSAFEDANPQSFQWTDFSRFTHCPSSIRTASGPLGKGRN